MLFTKKTQGLNADDANHPNKHASNKGANKKTHLQKSADWEVSRTYLLEKSESRAWLITRVAVLIAVLAIAAITILAPFYKIIPVVFRVDKLTNDILQVQVGKEAVPHSEVMDKHWLAQYVQQRERYIWTLLQSDFDTTMTLSNDVVANEYRSIYEGENALDKKLGESTDIRVKLISVELLPGDHGKGKARVIWERTMRNKGFDTERGKRFVSSISYKYIPNEALSQEKQLIANPFGFKVDGYAVATVLAADAKTNNNDSNQNAEDKK